MSSTPDPPSLGSPPTRGRVQYHEPGISNACILIDADGVAGRRIDPEYLWATIELHDPRASGTEPTFGEDGLCFVEAPSCVSMPRDLAELRTAYERELVALVERELDAREVVVFDHTLRGAGPGSRPPSHHVHCDYNASSAGKRMLELLGPERARQWMLGRYAIVNAWRPLVQPVERSPLGFVLPSSVASGDWVDVDIVFPDRRGQVRGLAWNPEHRWIYRDRMHPQQTALFTVYASSGVTGVAHAAVELLEAPEGAPLRQSIESRMFVRFE